MRLSGLQQGDYGCLAVLGVVLAVEFAGAKNQQMITHAVARHKRAHPVITTAVVLTGAATTVSHLLEWLNPDIDPFTHTYAVLDLFRRHMIHAATPSKTTTITGT